MDDGWVVVTDDDLALHNWGVLTADVVEAADPPDVRLQIALAAADALVSDAKLGKLVRRLLAPPQPVIVPCSNVIDLYQRLEEWTRRKRPIIDPA